MAVEKIKGERTLKALKPGAGRINDGGGLYLVPFAWQDSHYWRLDYTHQGRRRTMSLGAYPEIGLDSARSLARAARDKLLSGVDPMDDRQEAREKQRQRAECVQRVHSGLPPIGSFEEVSRRWFEVKKGQWMDSYSSKVIRRLELHAFPRFGSTPIGEITPKKVLDACRAVERNDTLETAHRLREHCSCVFRFAIAEGRDLRDPCQDIRDALKRPAVKHFAAITKPGPLAVLLRAIDSYQGSFVVRSALQLTPLLMLRPGELRQARWEEFDLDNGLFYVPSSRLKRTKVEKQNGQPHLVPLAKQAVGILEELYRHTGHTGLVFPASGRTGRCMSDNTLNAALRAMGYLLATTTELQASPPMELQANAQRQLEATLSRALELNDQFFQQERDKLEAWADDRIASAEQALKDTKLKLKGLKRQARMALSMEDAQRLQQDIRNTEAAQRRQRQDIFAVEDEIEARRDALITALQKRLHRASRNQSLFVVRWSVV